MKTLNCTLETINNVVELYIIGDTHIGSSQFNEPLLVDLIAHVLEKKNRYVVLNGDICDMTFKDSKGNVYENEMTPQVALSYACKLLMPLAEKGKILCTIGGNHDDDRSMRLVGISMAQQLATLLGIPDIYSPDSALIFANVLDGVKGHKDTDITYYIFVNHGNNGNGGSTGAKANALERMNQIVPNADVYIHNHTHAPITFKDEYVSICERSKSIQWKERLYVNGNAFMKYFNGYGEKKMMKPQSQSIPVIKLKSIRTTESYKGKRTIDRLHKTMSCEI